MDAPSPPPFSKAPTAAVSHTALTSRQTPVAVSLGALRIWWAKYKRPEGAETAGSAQELEEKYGDSIRHVALEHPIAFNVFQALRKRDHPLCITGMVANKCCNICKGATYGVSRTFVTLKLYMGSAFARRPRLTYPRMPWQRGSCGSSLY